MPLSLKGSHLRFFAVTMRALAASNDRAAARAYLREGTVAQLEMQRSSPLAMSIRQYWSEDADEICLPNLVRMMKLKSPILCSPSSNAKR